jgi:hypothetical protein
MATFRELVNDLERESGTIYQAQRLATVAAPVGRQEKMVEWVREAWRLIQTSRTDWRWMRGEFTSALVAGQRRYAPADLGIADFGGWPPPRPRGLSPFTLYDPAAGPADECEVRPVDHDEWRARWDRGVHDAQRPRAWSVDGAGRLCFGPKPDKPYVIRGDYRRSAQILAADGDVPVCPTDFHDAILWRAMVLMGSHDEAQMVVAHGQSNFSRIYRDMVNDSAGVMVS